MSKILAKKAELSILFKIAVEHNNFKEFLEKSRVLLSSLPDTDLKNVVELTIREVLVELIMLKTDISMLERVFQFSIDAALYDIASTNVPVLILGDMFDSSTIVECEKLFVFVETRVETFKKEFFFKMCKNYLLRSCNDLLRRLSRSQNTVFCGRILLFLAHLFPLSERSGLNIVSEFNLENATMYSTDEDLFSDITSEKGDVVEEGEITSNNQSTVIVDKNLYQKFWSLQDFFRCPNTCYNKMQWRHFTGCTSEVLTVFGSFKSDDANSSKWKLAKLPTSSGVCVYFAKYLTSPKLLELELSDSHFRRYVLVQFLILFQYLTLQVKFKLESYQLTDEQQGWVKDTSKKVHELLEETPPNGANFAKNVEKILQREEYWNSWKNEGCPDFRQAIEKVDIEKKSRKRPWEDFHTYKCKTNTEMSKQWSSTPNNWEACKSAKRNFVPTLESFFGISGVKSETGGSTPKVNTNDSKYTWKALRLLGMKSPHFFTSNPALNSLSEYLQSVIQKMAKEKPPVQDNVVETSVTEDSIEDGNDEFLPASEEDTKDEEKPKKDVLTKPLVDILSAKLQDHWQSLAIQLGFQDDEIEYYETFSNGKTQAEQMLTVWMEQDGALPAFMSALDKASMLPLVANVAGLLQQD